MSNALTALTDEDKTRFIPVVDEILKSSDLYTITIKRVRNGLSERTGIDFSAVKKAIDKVITDRFDILLAEHNDADNDEAEAKEEQPEDEPEEEDVKPAKEEASSPEPEFSQAGSASPFQGKKRKSSSSVEEDARIAAELHAQLNGGRPHRGTTKTKPVKKPGKKRTKKKSKDTISDASGDEVEPTKKKRKANPNNAFMKPLILSQPLATFIGETQMARPEVVKRIWAYVKTHNLQDPTDRRYILCDDNMKPVFGDKVHMFTMNKVLANNMYKADEVAQPGAGDTVVPDVAQEEVSEYDA